MNTLAILQDQSLLDRLGWSLAHSLWQGALVALCLLLALRLLARRSANARYLACCVALGLTLLWPVVTFCRGTPSVSGQQANELATRRSGTDIAASALAMHAPSENAEFDSARPGAANAALDPPAEMRPEGDEAPIGNDLVKVFPVQTFISSIKTDNADCFVKIVPRLENDSGEALPDEIRNAILELVPQVETRDKKKLLFHVSYIDGRADRTIEWFRTTGARELARLLSFEDGVVSSTSYSALAGDVPR
jgi:hypothetical protein